MSYRLNNDVLSIISLYVGFSIKYEKNKLKINLNNNCESCNKRMRRTKKSMIEAYAFPKLWEIDEEFYNEQSKYIKTDNTFILHKKIYVPYDQAHQNGLISYDRASLYQRGYLGNNDHLYGSKVFTEIDDIKIYVKKAPSLHLMYRALRNALGCSNNEEQFLEKLKKYEEEGFDEDIMNQMRKDINITDFPIKMVVRLCSKCRKKVKKGYIFT